MKTLTKRSIHSILMACLGLMISHITLAKPFATTQWHTKNGALVIFYEAMDVPMLNISIGFAAGSAYDGETFGISRLTTQLLNQGNNGLSSNVLAKELAATGAQYDAESNKDMVILNLKTLTTPTQLKKANDLFSLIISHPDFPIDSFTREKQQQLMAIKQSQELPDEMANQTFFQILYKNHPYGHPNLGNRESVQALTIEAVHHFYKQFFVSNNAIIILAGAVDKSTAEALAEQLTNNLPQGDAAAAIPPAEALHEEINIEIPFSSSQTILRLGQLGVDHHGNNNFALQVGNYILGGGSLTSKLSEELREKRALTYGIYSQLAPMPGKGPFLISFSTRHRQAKRAKELTREILTNFIKIGPSTDELQAAKQYLTGSFPLSLTGNRNIATMLLKIAFYHLPDDYLQTYIEHINAVTTEEIKTAFQQLIHPNKLLEIAVGRP